MQGRKVKLRPVDEADYPLLQKWQNDPEVAMFMDYRTPFSLREIAEDQERARAEGRPFVIEMDGHPIGKCGLNQIRWESRVCALYIYIGESDLWSQGLGRDATMTLLGVAFDDLGMERVELTMLAHNERAQRMYEKCGFQLEAKLRGRSYRAGTWHDTVVMSVSRGEWTPIREAYGI